MALGTGGPAANTGGGQPAVGVQALRAAQAEPKNLTEKLAAGLKAGIYRPTNGEPAQTREPPRAPARRAEPVEQVQGDEGASAHVDASDAASDDAAGSASAEAETDTVADATESDGPPSHWSEQEKALWDGLPVETKAAIARREKEQATLYETRGKEAAAERTKYAKAAEEARTHAQQQLAAVNALYTELRKQTLGQEPDWEQVLRNEGSEAYQLAKINWDKRSQAFEGLSKQIGQAMNGLKEQAKKAMDAIRSNESAALRAKMPDWADAKKAEAKWKEIAGYLTGPQIGFEPDQLGDLIDHRLYLVLEDALAHRRHLAKRAETAKQVKAAPKMASPGPKQSTTAPVRRLSEARKEHAEARNTRSLARVFQQFRSAKPR